jgi:hypothetical protein
MRPFLGLFWNLEMIAEVEKKSFWGDLEKNRLQGPKHLFSPFFTTH